MQIWAATLSLLVDYCNLSLFYQGGLPNVVWVTLLQPIAMSHNRPLPQYMHHLLHTPGIVAVHNGRRQAADKSYIFCVSLGGSGGGRGQNSLCWYFVCVCVCVYYHVFPCISVCLSIPVYMDECVCLPTVILLSQTKEPIGSCGKMRT